MKSKLIVNSFCISLILCWMSCPSSAQLFEDVTNLAGVNHTYGIDDFGGGVSFHDFDLDGWDDLTFATGDGDSIIFYKNMGGHFQRISFPDIHLTGHTKQLLWCDYDNDGDKDFLATGKWTRNYLYVNDGNFNFTPLEIPGPANFDLTPTYGASFGDIDLDGDLDLFICNRTITEPIPNQLFINNGDGSFTEQTGTFLDGVYQYTFASAFVDLNKDRLPDLYTAEDRQSVNQIYMNQGGGVFSDECEDCGAEIVIDAMCVAPGDYDNDADLDIYVTNTAGGNALLDNDGGSTYTNVAGSSGTGYHLIGWCSTFFDYDHDMDLDLYVSGSSVTVTMASYLYDNQGDGTFIIGNGTTIFNDSSRSFSHAIADMDHDGFYDIAVSNILPDSGQIWKYDPGPNPNNWIKIDLEGTVSNREGIGSWIEVWTDGLLQVKYTTCGVGYLSQNSGTEIFGIGSNNIADSIIIKWPSGIDDRLYGISSNQKLHITEGSTSSTSVEELTEYSVSIYPNPTNRLLSLQFEDDFIREINLEFFDMSGRRVLSYYNQQLDNNSISLNVSSLQEGIYTLKIRNGNKVGSKRIMVTR